MALVSAKCTNCGGILEVDNSKDAMNCKFCSAAFIVEKAINNYVTNNHTSNNIKASVVNIYGAEQTGFIIRGGVLEKYIGAETDVVIPDSVTIIGKEAFRDCKGITSVTFSNSVKRIDDGEEIPYLGGIGAFSGCESLEVVVFSDSLSKIGAYAFSSCENLKSISIPDSVTILGKGVFYLCTKLREINDSFKKRVVVGAYDYVGDNDKIEKYDLNSDKGVEIRESLTRNGQINIEHIFSCTPLSKEFKSIVEMKLQIKQEKDKKDMEEKKHKEMIMEEKRLAKEKKEAVIVKVGLTAFAILIAWIVLFN